MTPSSLLREQARQLLALADALDGAQQARPATTKADDDWIDITRAEKATRHKVSRTTLRRWGERYGVGEQTPTGQWRFRRAALIEFATTKGQRRGANGANGAADPIEMAREDAHLETQER